MSKSLLLIRRMMMPQAPPRVIYGYDVVGNPSIAGGLLSVSDNVSGIVCPEPFSPGANSWEIVMKVRSATSPNYEDLLYSLDATKTPVNEILLEADPSTIQPYARFSGHGSWDPLNAVSNPLQANVWIYLRLRYDPAVGYYLDTSPDGTTWAENITSGNNTPIEGGWYPTFGYAFGGGSNYFQGEWDLNETYIKIGGNIWWKPIQ